MRISATLSILLAWSSTVLLAISGAAAPVSPGGGRIPAPNPVQSPPIDEIARGRNQACSGTSRAALRACSGDVDDEYWTSLGKCMNLADATARQQCMDEAKAAMDEAQALCSEQYAAREQVCAQLGQDPYDPAIVPSHFLSPEQAAANPNSFFPLVPGTTWRYVGGGEVNDIEVTGDIKEIKGVPCFVVRDVVRQGGVITEDTEDWFALDTDGNVWYLGEHSETWEDGELVALDGTWKTDVNGAKPGIVMKADPQVEDVYRQEYLLSEAEDMGEVTSITGTESAPAGSCNGDCVVAREYTPIEPGGGEQKYYANGIGLIIEVDEETGDRIELTEYHPAVSLGVRGASPSGPQSQVGLLSGLKIAGPAGAAGTGSPIQFDLGREADVNVDIYDPAGRRIRSIFAGRRVAGRHAFTWEATDESGLRVASGIYFVRVRAGAESATGRIAVLAR